MTHVAWDRVTRDDVVRAIGEYDRLGPERFFADHGFGPTTTYDLIRDERRYPPTSSPPASASIPVISRAGNPARSRCSES